MIQLLHANDRSGQHTNSWYRATTECPEYPRLRGNHTADVCVIGAGYTGLSTALHLARAGSSVIVLDAHRVGWGASGRNGGQLGSGFNQSQMELEKQLGARQARALWDIAQAGHQTIKTLCAEYHIDCEYRKGIVYAQHRHRQVAPLHAYCQWLEDNYSHTALQALDRDQLQQHVVSEDFHGGAIDRDAAHLHPLKLAVGLARAAGTEGAVVYEQSQVLRIDRLDESSGSVQVVTATGRVSADRVVIACNGYLDSLAGRYERHIMPINNFVVATEPLHGRLDRWMPSGAAICDSRFVVNYFRPTPDGRLLFGGGETYGYRFPNDIASLVRGGIRKILPELADERIAYAWGGTLAITRSRLPCVRWVSPRGIAAGGYSGHGVGLAVQTGELIAETLGGTHARFNLLEDLPAGPFPGGKRSRQALLALAMRGYSWLDHL